MPFPAGPEGGDGVPLEPEEHVLLQYGQVDLLVHLDALGNDDEERHVLLNTDFDWDAVDVRGQHTIVLDVGSHLNSLSSVNRWESAPDSVSLRSPLSFSHFLASFLHPTE